MVFSARRYAGRINCFKTYFYGEYGFNSQLVKFTYIIYKFAKNLTNFNGDVIMLTLIRAINSAGECYLHMVEVTGSNPVLPTSPNLKRTPFVRIVLGFFFALFRLLPCRVTPLYCRCNAFRVFGGKISYQSRTNGGLCRESRLT